MDECIRWFMGAAGVTLVEAIEAATLHPAQALNIQDTKGTLDFGSDADLVFLDDSDGLKVLHTFIAGRCIWSLPGSVPLSYKAL